VEKSYAKQVERVKLKPNAPGAKAITAKTYHTKTALKMI
jgi:hypothetical protein